jgi:hypothetical protein
MSDTRELHVTMPDGSVWAVPVAAIVASARRYYEANRTEDSAAELMVELEADDTLVVEWAEGDMNWSEVSEIARQVSAPTLPDYQEGWMNGDKEII